MNERNEKREQAEKPVWVSNPKDDVAKNHLEELQKCFGGRLMITRGKKAKLSSLLKTPKISKDSTRYLRRRYQNSIHNAFTTNLRMC